MAKGKTAYTFNYNNPNQLNQAVQMIENFLNAYRFTLQKYKATTAYSQGDGFSSAKRFIEYYVNGNTITILAYVRSIKAPYPLDDSYYLCVPKGDLKQILFPLLQQLEALQNGMPIQNMQQNINNNMSNSYYNNSSYDLSSVNTTKGRDIMTILGFIVSLLNLLICTVYTLIISISFGIYGLKSKHKGLSITTIILSCIALIIRLFYIILKATL